MCPVREGPVKCRGCGADMIFVKSPAGRSIRCDKDKLRVVADPAGKLRVVRDNGSVIAARRPDPTKDGEAVEWALVSHFSTCPQAAEFRKPRAK